MIHLRLKTEYTFGQTFASIPKMIERLKEINCTAAGIVDTNSTWGHVKWFDACKAAGIQPLLGVELTVTETEDFLPKMWFLAQNEEGLRETYRLSSRAHSTPVLTRRGSIPRLYPSDVLGISPNILVFAGEITDGAFLKAANAIVDLNPSSRVLNMKKKAVAAEHGLRIVSTADNSFVRKEDAPIYELMSRGGMKPTPQFVLDNLEHQDVAEEIAASCSELKLPVAPMISAEGDLEQICRDGIKARGMEWNDVYEERLKYELEMIRSKNFDAYFIIVADMVRYAKQHMLVGPSRGSSAGSLVCYVSRITEIDPIPPGLYFERFIDVSRSDLPDIDLDFPDTKREMVFKYMMDKYGAKNTAHIGTISVFQPKSALIQVCKSLNIPPSATAAVKLAMIERGIADSRAGNCLEDTLHTTDAGKAFVKSYPQAVVAGLLEGHASHTGVHAAGLLVCNDEITNYATVDQNGIAHVEKFSAERLGLLKIDVLGLRTLGVLEDSGVPIDWYNLKFDDPATFAIFNTQRLNSIFQFEGQALQSLSKNIVFKTMTEIDAITALARPGPFGSGIVQEYLERKAGKKFESIHPLVERIMRETMGLPLYQEQTFAIVREIGKFNWAETTFIRKGISKRMGKEFFGQFWPRFKEGAATEGIDEKAALKIWELINAMGAWQMNKAHTYSYAVISYWCAYLKAHHPLEFAAANLRNAKDEDSAVQLLREMVKEGVEYEALNIELSEKNWCVKNGKLIGGFMSLKGFGESMAEKMVTLRNEGKLKQEHLDKINKAENIFKDIFPMQTKYGAVYDNPALMNISGELDRIEKFDGTQTGTHVFVGEIVYKNARNENEEVNVKKRNGKLKTGPLDFVDLRVRDDTATIGVRISRFDHEKVGKHILETVPIGTHVLIRARFIKDIRFGFIQKIKILGDEDVKASA